MKRTMIFLLMVGILFTAGCYEKEEIFPLNTSERVDLSEENQTLNDSAIFTVKPEAYMKFRIGDSLQFGENKLTLLEHTNDGQAKFLLGDKKFTLFTTGTGYPIDNKFFFFVTQVYDNVHKERDFVAINVTEYTFKTNEYLMKVDDFIRFENVTVSVYDIIAGNLGKPSTVIINIDMQDIYQRSYTVPEGTSKEFTGIKITNEQVYPYPNEKDQQALLIIEQIPLK